jgi:putative transposase
LKVHLKEDLGMNQIHGSLGNPQIQGKIERYHKSMKNIAKLDHYFDLSEIEKALEKLANYYNNERQYESLNNLTLTDVYFGRGEAILEKRERIKRKH